jgi:hypothetical protein
MTYKSMQGKEIDMDKLMRQNELMPAVGNVRVNARGDELGPGGVIIRKREDIINAYYEDNPAAAPMRAETVDPVVAEPVMTEEFTPVQNNTKSKKTQVSEEE